MSTIALLGNHIPPYSTESELDWTIQHMGYRLIRFQENQSRTEEILRACREQKVNLFLYVHTHGWDTPGTISLFDMLAGLKESGIKTASFHLDRYVGLNKADGREDRVGRHPFWHTDYVFTADGGNQEFFTSRGINHIWLPPAVVERDCYPGTPRDEFKVEIGFVGSEYYHPEYPFRQKLIGWLRDTYGDRFRRFGGDTPSGTVRGKDLNDLYASLDIAIGDSCFGGAENYWSDRIPETLGRGGFLIHPRTPGLNIPGLATYDPGNLDDLKRQIDYYLEHPDERREMTKVVAKHVREHDTYTQRMETILRTVGLL